MIQGNVNVEVIEDIIEKFIKKFLICSHCKLPEYIPGGKCNACGHNGDSRDNSDQSHSRDSHESKSASAKGAGAGRPAPSAEEDDKHKITSKEDEAANLIKLLDSLLKDSLPASLKKKIENLRNECWNVEEKDELTVIEELNKNVKNVMVEINAL